MTRNLYALLVGINEYDRRSPISPLKGCVNDIRGAQAYLESRVNKDLCDLHLHILTDEQATRQGVIDGFRQHLAQAGPEDVVLFYYAGHGSQAKVPKALKTHATDRLMSTLVCHDSRVNGHNWDIADIELALLIVEVDRRGAHTAVILDCCYTGSDWPSQGVPGVAIRRAPSDLRDRPLESFIVSPADAKPEAKNIVLSACAPMEAAKEYYGGGRPQGVFSHFLQKSLAAANGDLSYRQLHQRTNALMRSNVVDQSPQLNAAQASDLTQPFLDGAIAPAPAYFTVSHHPEDGWIINGGAVHGLLAPTGAETTRLALFPYYSPTAQMALIEEAITQTAITQVHPRYSKIDGSDLIAASPTDLFKAVVIEQPLPLVSVYIGGEMSGVRALKRAIATAHNRQHSLYVQATTHPNDASLRVLAANNTYTITDPTGARSFAEVVLGYDAATEVASNLEHIAKWQAITQFPSALTTPIQGSVNLKIYTGKEPKKENATEITSAQIRLTYQNRSGQNSSATENQIPPRFRIKLHNQSNQPLYCALFYLTERFKAAAIKPDSVSSVVRLLPDQEIWFAGGSPLNGRVPDSVWQKGITECQDMLKLVACVREFDPTLMNLGELGRIGRSEDGERSRPPTPGGSLNRLMQRTTHREVTFFGSPPNYDDWVTSQVAFTFVRPQLWVPLNSDEAIAISASDDTSATVKMHPHSQLSARIRLTSIPQATQAIEHPLPALLQAETIPFELTQSHITAAGLSVLELTDLAGSISSETPLQLETDMPLDEGEYVVPVAYNGEAYVSLGYGKTLHGRTQVVVERLVKAENVRSQNSVYVFLQKISAQRLKRVIEQKVGFAEERSLFATLINSINRSTTSPSSAASNRAPELPPNVTPIAPTIAAKPVPNVEPKASLKVGSTAPSKVAETIAATRQPNKPAYTAKPIPPARAGTIGATTVTAPTPKRPQRHPISQTVPLSSLPSPTQSMSSTDPSQDPSQPPSNEQPLNQPVNQPLNQPLNQQSRPPSQQPINQPTRQPPVHPPVPPAAQRPEETPEPTEVYAPQYEPSPESRSSPLMWIWVVSTAVIAAIVAIAWLQYLSGSDSPDLETPEASPTVEPALPAVPDSPPVAPENAPASDESEAN